MCGICGCADKANDVTLIDPETGDKTLIRQGGLLQEHNSDPHRHHHDHHPAHPPHEGQDTPHIHSPSGEVISLEQAILSKNDQIAARNRGWFEGRGVLALNLVSSPGAGKTTLLERTIRDLASERAIYVIEGDQMTSNDAERVRDAGAKALQINTGAGCHLEADMIADAVDQLDPVPGALLLIENVGNLVCPSMFDLGEKMKVAVISTTEGEDKPLKYPHMFRAAETVLINKIDISEVVEFDEASCRRNIAEVNPNATVISLSAKTGENFGPWLSMLVSDGK
ncbi:MAG: hydrogenase nickel incorporation protein HypB [Pseudomonadota bacterium]